jgi:hypothetical protein
MIDTNHWGYQQILREAIQYRILRRTIEASRASSPLKTESNGLDCDLFEALAAAH